MSMVNNTHVPARPALHHGKSTTKKTIGLRDFKFTIFLSIFRQNYEYIDNIFIS